MTSLGARVDIQSPLENKRLNLIPVGRQLQRTPPNKTPKSQTSHLSEGPAIKDEEDSQNVWQDETMCPSVEEERKSYRRSSITPVSVNMGNADPEAFVQGMQGYQWTDTDLEFVYQAKQQKQAQQLKQELSEVEKTLQAETQRLETAIASRDKLQSELSKTLSCDLLLQLCKSVLSRSRTPDQLEGLGVKVLLSMLNLQDIQQVVCEEKAQISSFEREAQELREKEEKAMKEIDTCQKKISILQANVDGLKVELIELKTQLSEKEALMVSQVPAKSSKASRRAKPSTKTLASEQDTAEESKTAPKKKAPKKTTSKKTSKKNTSPEEMAPNEMPAQVNTPVETDPKKKSRKVKFSNVGEVHEKGQKGSIMAKTSTMALKDKAQKKSALKESKENEMVPLEMADKEMAEKGKTAPKKKALKNTTSKKTAKKDVEVLQVKSPEEAAPEEAAPEEAAPEEAAPEELAPEVLPPKVRAQVLEKDCKGSRTAKPSSTMVTEGFLKKTALRKRGEKQTAQIETDEKGKTARNVKVPKKATSRKTAEKEMAPDEMASQVKILNENVLVRMASKMMTSKKTDEVEMSLMETAMKVKAPEEMSLETTAPTVKASKLKAPKKTTSRTTADMKMTAEVTVEGAMVTKKMTSKIRAPKKTTSKQKDLKELDMQEMATDENALKETVIKKGLEEASKKETSGKNKVKKETDPEETASEKMALKEVDEETTSTKSVRKKTAARVKAPKEMPEKEVLKETVSRKRASKEKAPKQKAEKNPSEDEIHLDEHFIQPPETEKNSSNAAQAPGKAQKAVKPPKSPVESNPEAVRRSKRNTVNNQTRSNTIPEKATRSRRR
ncbi:hypothetical protein QTP86_026684 [Hemibagrus guttatus]|nr:hypothetical protein QTP86_026684 [Hemibagrus guttatus]